MTPSNERPPTHTVRYYFRGMPNGSTRSGRCALPWLIVVGVPLAAACATSPVSNGTIGAAQAVLVEEGLASWYGYPYHGRPTASGTSFDMAELTAAHRTLPFGTSVRVTNLGNGRSVAVTINDRGPFVEGRIIDLSHRAAQVLDAVSPGVIPVRLEVLAVGDGMPAARCWEVQVGAFGDPANVERAVAGLRRRGLAPRTVPAPGGLTRVRVTSIVSRADATAVAGRVQDKFPGATVVPCGALP